jgi:hypothetical protein
MCSTGKAFTKGKPPKKQFLLASSLMVLQLRLYRVLCTRLSSHITDGGDLQRNPGSSINNKAPDPVLLRIRLVILVFRKIVMLACGIALPTAVGAPPVQFRRIFAEQLGIALSPEERRNRTKRNALEP